MAAETLTQAVSERWDRILENWALWRRGGTHAASTISSIYHRGESCDRWRRWDERGTPPPPAINGEAIDADAMVLRLSDPLRRAVDAWYCWTGTLAERAQYLGCHADTLRNRVSAAKGELERMRLERVAARRAITPSTFRPVVVKTGKLAAGTPANELIPSCD